MIIDNEVLVYVFHYGPATPKEVARMLGITPVEAFAALKKMAEEGLVKQYAGGLWSTEKTR